jgi:hypothetical protein
MCLLCVLRLDTSSYNLYPLWKHGVDVSTTIIIQVGSAAVASSIFQNCAYCIGERELVVIALCKRILIFIAWTSSECSNLCPSSSGSYDSPSSTDMLVDAHALRTIRLSILMLTIDRGKVI